MEKGIVVFDMPENCSSCPFLKQENLLHICGIEKVGVNGYCLHKRPCWCPIQHLSGMHSESGLNHQYGWHNKGWYVGVDEVLRRRNQRLNEDK